MEHPMKPTDYHIPSLTMNISPLGESVNDFIDPNLCSVSCTRFEDVIEKSPKNRKVYTSWGKRIFQEHFVYCLYILVKPTDYHIPSLTMNIHLFPVCQEI
jgi:hypothetical protein